MITPSDVQAKAIKAVESWYENPNSNQTFYLAGFAGTGKSTLAAMFLEDFALHAVTATYTGKAAHVLRRKGVNASTIHSLIYEPIPGSRPVEFRLAMESPLSDADLLVLDECSMISGDIAADLLSFGKKILVLGDPGQLPPVRGQGAFTNRKPDVFLSEIHRQALDSPILRLATMAREGKSIPMDDYGGGVQVCEYDRSYIMDRDTQVICGVHRNRWAITAVMRRELGIQGIEELYPAEGEPIMCCKNDRMQGLFNGMTGETIADTRPVDRGYLMMDVKCDEHEHELLVDASLFNAHKIRQKMPDAPRERGTQWFDFAYAITCHKAQGSEWPSVTVIDDSGAFREDRDRWLYTAITRASEKMTLLRMRD